MARPFHRCDECGKRRVGVTVVHVGGAILRDLCPACAVDAAIAMDVPKPKHRNCKQRVDRIMASATDPNRSPLVLRSDSKVLVEEIEDVRAERDELLKRVGNMVDAWDEAMVGNYGQPLTACMEQLRDMLPFPWPEAKTW